MSRRYFSHFVFAAILAALVVALGPSAQAQTFAVIQDFSGTSASFPATLVGVLGRDGNMYSESYNGGTNGAGTVFKASPTGTITVVIADWDDYRGS